MKLGMIGIIVEDIQESIQFYEVLGLSVSQVFGDDYVELENEGVRISLNTKSMVESIYGFEPLITGQRIELAFECTTNDMLDMLCTQLSSKGYTIFKAPWLAFWGQYYAIVLDPDENLISLYVNQT